MGEQIWVDPAALEQPARRFEAGADGLGQVGQAMRGAMRGAGQAAGSGVVAAAAETFGQAMGAVLDAFAAECRLMAGKVRGAGVRYRVTDETAVLVQLSGVDAPAGW